MLLHGAWFVSSSTWNVVQKLQSFTFMKFHVLGTFIFSSQFHEYIILTNSQSYKYWKIKSSKNRFAKFLLNIQPSVAKKCPRSTCTAPKLYRETLFPPPPAASLGREPGLADHSVEENFSQEEHQHQKDIGYFESNACSFGCDRNSGSSRRCLGRTEARFHFTAAKVLNWAVIVDNVHGAVHL